MIGWLKALYELVWRPTTHRPWTYQIRDWTRHHPLRVWPIVAVISTAFFVGQMEAVRLFGWPAAPFVVFADFMAYVAGHLWWDTGSDYVLETDDFK